jgi:Sortase domain
VRALEGGGPRRGRALGRLVGLAVVIAVLLAGAVLARESAPGRLGLPWLVARSQAFSTAPPAARPRSLLTPAPAPSPTSGTLAAAQAIVAPVPPPARLSIAAIGVDAAIEPLGLDGQGRMATPSRPDNVGWYSPGAAPGDVGNAVIDGHLDWTDGPAVFWRLGKLRRGDELAVSRADGSRARFLVLSTATMPWDASTDALFTKTGPPSLTLITCAGAWDRQRGTYLQRLVVRASLVPPPPTKSPGEEPPG